MEEKRLRKGDLSAACQRLIGLMQEIGFGRIEGLEVQGGEPCFASPISVVREVKLGTELEACPGSVSADFVLKREVLDLLSHLDHIGDGTVSKLEIRHGLPFRIHFEERLEGVSADSA